MKEKYWALHEAALMLTEWPETNMILMTVSPQLIKIDRSCIHLPENLKLDPKEYGDRFEGVYTPRE